MRWNSRWGVTRLLDQLRRRHAETVIQDVDIPLDRAVEFLAFMPREIGILPIWLCPIRAPAAAAPFALYPLRAEATYINFGFWDVIRDRKSHPPGYRNRLIERRLLFAACVDAPECGVESQQQTPFFPQQLLLSVGQYAGQHIALHCTNQTTVRRKR